VDDRPFAAFANPDGDRLHEATAIRLPVARLNIQVDGAKAVGAVVPMFGAAAGAYDENAAGAASECIVNLTSTPVEAGVAPMSLSQL
jgi:hypothetical protein